MSDDDESQFPVTDTERHKLLADERRRSLLEILASESCPIELETLAKALTKRADDSDGITDPETLQISLHHQHLPILRNYGIISYDPRERLVVEKLVDISALCPPADSEDES